ncbi:MULTISPECIES: PAS domain-containing sensor histidine kinase [Thiorhodovibrio]|uniref:PAS domain-containing sensor histidine kinase n=1 Tax=Thiorhodovibrio TaxID=61593 RepID=UPI0019115B15|nr:MULTISPECIES: PAS domain-containing protein [Thiorhodovibrio]MBK5969483.1 hypothetical protein [Thiorhodovibrio winogradskyi]WPL12375.1 Autoinducer 2 sensor kinase/phosphatase LuxQ [Thiorhodovibrio litoralis]
MSSDQYKTKQALIDELNQARRRIAELERCGGVSEGGDEWLRLEELRWCSPLAQLTEDALGVLDKSYVYQRVNPAYERFWGLSKEEIIGRSVTDLFGEAFFSSQLKDRLDRCLAGEVVRYSGWFEFPVLGRRHMDVTYQPLRDPEGRVTGLVNLARDMTGQALAEEQLKTLLQQTGAMAKVGGWELDARTLEMTWTEQTYAIHELPVGQMPSVQEAIDFYHPEDRPKIAAVVQAALEQAQPYDIEVRFITAKGQALWTRSIGKPVLKDGEVVKLTGAFQDVTARKQAELALQETKDDLEQAVRFANVGLWDWDFITNKVHYSEEWKGQIGYADDEIGDAFEEWQSRVHPDDLDKALAHFDQAINTKADRYELVFRFRHKDGHYIWVLAQAFIHQDPTGKPIRIIGSHIDITNQKALEQELIEAKERAEAASQARSEFLANMSHEIRTPLNGVMGMLQVLDDAELEPQFKEAVSIAMGSSQTLLTVINDILDFSKIEAGKLSIAHEPFNLNALLPSVIAAFRQQAANKGVALHSGLAPDLPARVLGDAARLRQVLFNLLGNAIKFTERGEVRLDTRVLSGKDPARMRLEFAISDTGIGIPEDRLADIFESFTQVDSSNTRRFQGSGLGLAIVRRLVGLMDGQVTIASTLGQGTEVRFDIRVETAAEDELAPHEPVRAGLRTGLAPTKALQVLVVDDEPTNTKVLSMMLNKLGHQVQTAANGRQALDRLRSQAFDLVFMDASMPEMDGLEATRHIRDNQDGDLNPSVPIVALTAHAMKGDRERFLAAGMDDYLSKPIVVQALHDALHRVMGKGNSRGDPVQE